LFVSDLTLVLWPSVAIFGTRQSRDNAASRVVGNPKACSAIAVMIFRMPDLPR
jgi:hypothetical protein